MSSEQRKLLEKILGELQNIALKLDRLHCDLGEWALLWSKNSDGTNAPTSVNGPLTNLEDLRNGDDVFLKGGEVVSKEKESAKTLSRAVSDPPRSLAPSPLVWLSTRKISIRKVRYEEPFDEVFDKLALFLGGRFSTLHRLHELIRRNLSTGRDFRLHLSSSSQEEIANTTQFCVFLHRYAFLQSYTYSKKTRTILASPQRDSKTINFFNGVWFERYVFLKTNDFLLRMGLSFNYLTNAQINLPNGDYFELDLLFLLEDATPIWLECKTGSYQNYIIKYSQIRPILDVPKENAILIILEISPKLCEELENLYGITVANENNFIEKIARALGLEDKYSREAIANNPKNSANEITTALKKSGVQPLPELRLTVLKHLLIITRTMSRPLTILEVKELLHERIACSKRKIQFIVNAALKGGCFIDDTGAPVMSHKERFSKLASDDIADLERKCVECYARALLLKEPDFFTNTNNRVRFEEVVGSKSLDEKRIKELLEEIQKTKFEDN